MAGTPASNKGPQPICYMVMPFRKKKVEEPLPAGAPAEIDFDALWEKAYWPAIKAMGFLPMRADFDNNSVIVKAMLERITYADLVIADVTLGNGNVYYEVGIRHVAKSTACVMVAAAWSRPLFDISQFACVRFPLEDGDISVKEAKAIREVLEKEVPALIESPNPFHALLQASDAKGGREGTFREFAKELSAFQAKVKTVRLETQLDRRQERLRKLLAEVDSRSFRIPEVALDLVALIRDTLDWKDMRAFVRKLPKNVRDLPFVREQDLLALAKGGDPVAAVAHLEQFIHDYGDTPERSGLLGGRYKQLWRKARAARERSKAARQSADERRFLESAIASYRRGMELDYNQYYCPHNLALLLRARKGEGDLNEAAIVDHFVLAACERARKRDEQDEWIRATLLGAAFRTGDVEKAGKWAHEVSREGHATWKLETTIGDLEESVRQTADGEKREKLEAIYWELAELLKEPAKKRSARKPAGNPKAKARQR